MKFSDVSELFEYRNKLNKITPPTGEMGTSVVLYSVYHSLDMPVITIVRISKRYLYDDEGNKHNFGRYDMTVFTSKSEAWRFFTQKLHEKQNELHEYYEKEKLAISKSIDIFEKNIEMCPQYFM